MHAKHRFLITLFLLLTLSITASAESTPFFPCVLNHPYESSQYEEYVEIDLKEWYRSDIDNWVDDGTIPFFEVYLNIFLILTRFVGMIQDTWKEGHRFRGSGCGKSK